MVAVVMVLFGAEGHSEFLTRRGREAEAGRDCVGDGDRDHRACGIRVSGLGGGKRHCAAEDVASGNAGDRHCHSLLRRQVDGERAAGRGGGDAHVEIAEWMALSETVIWALPAATPVTVNRLAERRSQCPWRCWSR
jgi:hypothetical protein